jgi:catechol 2,3-dioxygenase-like lactoylglutathione lyase family enzyme
MLTDAPVIAIVPTTDIARAREFYEGTLGLQAAGVDTPEPQAVVLYRCGDGSTFQVYERETAGDAQHTLASWAVPDVPAAVEELRGRGVRFEDYDRPDFKTKGGIATMGEFAAAWFKDPDGNILCVHSLLQ